MENRSLFRLEKEGYNCEDVEQYINALKAEYKKVYEYAKVTEANNEKIKKICLALSAENKELKASGAVPAASESVSAASIDKIIELADMLAAEAAQLKTSSK